MTESKELRPTRAELAFEKWNASSASDKFEINSIETYTAFLAGFEAAQSELKLALPWHEPTDKPVDLHVRILGIKDGRVRFGPPANSKGQHTGNYSVYYDETL